MTGALWIVIAFLAGVVTDQGLMLAAERWATRRRARRFDAWKRRYGS